MATQRVALRVRVGVLFFLHRTVLVWFFVLLLGLVDLLVSIKDLKLFYLIFRRGADHREAASASVRPPLQWNCGGVGDSVLTTLSSAVLAAVIFFALSVSLMANAT